MKVDPWLFSFFISFSLVSTCIHVQNKKHCNVSKLKTHCKPCYVFFECNHTLFNGLLQEMQMQRRGELHCSEKAQQSMEKKINLLSFFLMFPISKFFTLMHKNTTRFHARFATRFHSYIQFKTRRTFTHLEPSMVFVRSLA
jgi:hypothetical protein